MLVKKLKVEDSTLGIKCFYTLVTEFSDIDREVDFKSVEDFLKWFSTQVEANIFSFVPFSKLSRLVGVARQRGISLKSREMFDLLVKTPRNFFNYIVLKDPSSNKYLARRISHSSSRLDYRVRYLLKANYGSFLGTQLFLEHELDMISSYLDISKLDILEKKDEVDKLGRL